MREVYSFRQHARKLLSRNGTDARLFCVGKLVFNVFLTFTVLLLQPTPDQIPLWNKKTRKQQNNNNDNNKNNNDNVNVNVLGMPVNVTWRVGSSDRALDWVRIWNTSSWLLLTFTEFIYLTVNTYWLKPQNWSVSIKQWWYWNNNLCLV